jgi:hypothetical protein
LTSVWGDITSIYAVITSGTFFLLASFHPRIFSFFFQAPPLASSHSQLILQLHTDIGGAITTFTSAVVAIEGTATSFVVANAETAATAIVNAEASATSAVVAAQATVTSAVVAAAETATAGSSFFLAALPLFLSCVLTRSCRSGCRRC